MIPGPLSIDTDALKIPKTEDISPQPLKVPKLEAPSSPQPFLPIASIMVKPEYQLLPLRPNGPVYSLVYQGPAPEGWEKNADWNQNVSPVDGVVYYKNDHFYLSNSN